MKVILLAHSPGKDILFEVGDSEITLGRGNDVHVQVNDSNCSRNHCKFLVNGGQFWVEDMASKNGTIVNGVSIQKTRIYMGDNIIVGDTQISIPADRNAAAVVRILHFDGDTQERQRKNINLQDTSELTNARHHPLTTIKKFSPETKTPTTGKKNGLPKKEIENKDPPAWMTSIGVALDYGFLITAIVGPIVFARIFGISKLLFGLDTHFSGVKDITLSTGIAIVSGFIFWLINTKNSGGSIGERFVTLAWYNRQKKN